MERIIDGRLYEGKRVPDQWDISIWEQHGHREISAANVIEWVEVGAAPSGRAEGLLPGSLVLDSDELARLVAREKADAEERRLDNLKRNARRAKTACRRIIKAAQFNELGTLTYRDNQQDRALCKEHFKEWVRRMKRHFGGVFRYCASFERQDRGAMHVHLAMHKFPVHASAKYKGVKVPAWRIGTLIWRDIVGKDNGLFYVGGKPSKFGLPRARMGLAKMAAYVSKYIMKDYADADVGSNRYSRSNDVEVTKPDRVRLVGASLAEIISATFTCRDGDVVVSHSASEEQGRYWLCTEGLPPRRDVVRHPDALVATRAQKIAMLVGMRDLV